MLLSIPTSIIFRLAPLTPRSRRASSLPSSLSPQSPVAAAAHAVSLEESSRSTARMKRAAEAIALEDETLSLSRSRARNLVRLPDLPLFSVGRD